MAARNTKKKGLSWELIGIAAVVGLVVVFGVLALANPEGSGVGEIFAPDVVAQDPGMGLDQASFSGQDAEGRPYLGAADAPVTVYEFADFQCPHCRDFSLYQGKTIKQDLVASGKAKLVWVAFPFMGQGGPGDESVSAQMAAQCGNQQGKFWAMHDWLFKNQAAVANSDGFSTDRLRQMAEKVGLDMTAYDACMADDATRDFVTKGKDLGVEKSVSSTPSFLIEGQDKLYEGTAADVLEDLRAAIEQAAGGS